jgi:AcrR family transcriptional regulator
MAAGSTSTARRATSHRMTADERRANVIEAAKREFSENGYHATSTAQIAKRAGISQPYIYALFPDKRTLFLAVYEHTIGRIRDAFLSAAEGEDGSEARLAAMGVAYTELVRDPVELRCQLQAHAAAAGDPELQRDIRAGFEGLWRDVARASGAEPERLLAFFATGMLLNVKAALDIPELEALG